MENKELVATLRGLSTAIEIKNEISELKAGHLLDERFAIEILGFKKSGLVTEVTLPSGEKVATHYSLPDGKPALLPPISRDENLAAMLLKDMNQNFAFEFRDGKFKVPFEDKAAFETDSLGEGIQKSLLFGKAILEAGVTLD